MVTLVLLLGITADRALLGRASIDSEAYHARVREAAESIPFIVDNWLGVDVPIPQGAITLLKPNVILSRRYQEIASGRAATLLLVHCRDARDLLGHYPPVCYAGQGWRMESSARHDWTVDGQVYQGTRYVFQGSGPNSNQSILIDNFMLLPNRRTARDMDEVDQSARDSTLKHFGAAQVQIVHDSRVPEQQRQQTSEMLIRESQPLIQRIMAPVGEKKPGLEE